MYFADSDALGDEINELKILSELLPFACKEFCLVYTVAVLAFNVLRIFRLFREMCQRIWGKNSYKTHAEYTHLLLASCSH